MTEQMQKDAELYRSMRDMAKARGFESVAEAILAGPKERQRAELAEADNAKLLDLSQRLLDFATKGAPEQGDDAFLAALGHAVTQPHPGAALLDEVEKLRALQVPVSEDGLTKLVELLASAKQGDVWAWLDRAREDVPKLVEEVRRLRAALAAPPGQVESDVQTIAETLALLKPSMLDPFVRGQGKAVLQTAFLAHSRVALMAQRAHALELRTQADALKHQELDATRARAEQERDAEDTEAKKDAAELRALFKRQEARVQAATEAWRAAHNQPLVSPDLGTLVEWLLSRAGLGMALAPEVREKVARALEVVRQDTPLGLWNDAAEDALSLVLALDQDDVPAHPKPLETFLEECSGSPIPEDELLHEAASVAGPVGKFARAVLAAWMPFRVALKAAGWQPG